MKRNIRTILIVIGVVIVGSNTPPIQYFLLENYHYQNKDNSFNFTEEPAQALDFEVCEIRWKRFLAENPNTNDKILYRTFRIKPWQFWEWWQFIAHSGRYNLPYLESHNNR